LWAKIEETKGTARIGRALRGSTCARHCRFFAFRASVVNPLKISLENSPPKLRVISNTDVDAASGRAHRAMRKPEQRRQDQFERTKKDEQTTRSKRPETAIGAAKSRLAFVIAAPNPRNNVA
jgi:hypothetical protein